VRVEHEEREFGSIKIWLRRYRRERAMPHLCAFSYLSAPPTGIGGQAILVAVLIGVTLLSTPLGT
jgi:hypothetical protein